MGGSFGMDRDLFNSRIVVVFLHQENTQNNHGVCQSIGKCNVSLQEISNNTLDWILQRLIKHGMYDMF